METGDITPAQNSLRIKWPQLENWSVAYDECLGQNGAWGCSFSIHGSGKMAGVELQFVEAGYWEADGTPNHPSTLFCYGDKCKDIGFAKPSEWDGWYVEP